MKESYEKRGGSSLKGCTLSDEHIKNITLAVQGENNPMFGKTQSTETKQKISDKAKGRKSKMKGQINETIRSRKYKWYNDGVTSFFMPEGTQPENYKLGRIKTWKNRLQL
jgi:hypothetical protein